MAQYLLDTHSFLWYVPANPALSDATRAIIQNAANQVFVSAASIWEISIKQGLGKLPQLPEEPEQLLRNVGLLRMDIKIEHAMLAGQLPLIHRDPFDRMLIAQAQLENLILITGDGDIGKYQVPTLRP